MKRFVLFVLALALVLSMSVSAFAVTPKLSVPKIPQIPTIKAVKIELPRNFWDNFVFNWNGKA